MSILIFCIYEFSYKFYKLFSINFRIKKNKGFNFSIMKYFTYFICYLLLFQNMQNNKAKITQIKQMFFFYIIFYAQNSIQLFTS